MNLNEQLKQLALTAQQHPPRSRERQTTLEQLFQEILNSGKLCRPRQGTFIYHYEEIYQEARQNLFEYICNNIHKYESERAEVMTWCNFLLETRFFREAIPKVLGRRDIQITSIADLDKQASSEPLPDLAEDIKSYIELDPDNLFKQAYIKNHPAANFSALFKLLHEGRSWKEISEIFEIPIPTLSSFYQRCLKRFVPKIKEYLKNI